MVAPPLTPDSVYRHQFVESVYVALEQAAQSGQRPQSGIWKRLQAAVMMLHQNVQWGEVIPARSIPAYFRKRYGATNLYCIDLAQTVRCFYTISDHDVVFLDIVDHGEYDKWFPPKGRTARRR